MIRPPAFGPSPIGRQVLPFPGTRVDPRAGVCLPDDADPDEVLLTEAARLYPGRWPGEGHPRYRQHLSAFVTHVATIDVSHMSRADHELAQRVLAGFPSLREAEIAFGVFIGYELGLGFYLKPRSPQAIVTIQRGFRKFVFPGNHSKWPLIHLRHGDFITINRGETFIFADPLIFQGHPKLSGVGELFRGDHVYAGGMPGVVARALFRLNVKGRGIPKTGVVQQPRANLIIGAKGDALVRLVSDGGEWRALGVTDYAPEGLVVRLIDPGKLSVIDVTKSGTNMALLADGVVVQVNSETPFQVVLSQLGNLSLQIP